jgi:monoamine oxidase
MTDRQDVVVVGGGLAGLAAARTLQAAGLDPLVFEARNRVGGKADSEHTAYGDVIERGGQWVGADQGRVTALIDEFDLETRQQYADGAVLGRLGDDRTVADTYEELLRSLPEESVTELFSAFEEIERCVELVPRAAPQDAPNAAEWDSLTLQTWIERQFETAAAQAAFERMIPGIYTAEPGAISFLFFCYYARTAGGFDMVAGLDPAQDSHATVVVDVNAIARSLAAELGDAVHCGQPVRRIEQDGTTVHVETHTQTVHAAYAVVALPPTIAGGLTYDPPLPVARDELTQRMPNGAVIKCHLRYDEPFWRQEGLSGFVEDSVGPAAYYFDDGRPDAETGRLVGFICGARARKWAPSAPEERRRALTEQLAAVFDDRRFARPVEYTDRAWGAEPYSRGAYHGYPTPGTITDCWDAIRAPVGRLHWAGAETATRWYGHMEGAIRSGERAAAEIRDRRREQSRRNGS